VTERTDTRRRMIEAAAVLFQRDGYRATSWRKLVEAAGTPWGSAHHHFPGGKEQLGVAAVELGSAAVASFIEDCFARTRSPAGGIRRWFDASAALLERSDFRGGCPIATVALETVPESEALTEASSAGFQRWQATVAEQLAAAGIPARRARALAGLALTALEGGLVLSRVARDTAPLRQAGEHVAGVVADATP
jgi:TetR/AcrR family transcriptional repressor of lmrAB and yxaGH operons